MILTMDDVSFAHRRGRRRIPVLLGFDLELAPQERLALLGESGSGKSTVLALASGVAVADSGTVTLQGRNLASLSVAQRAALRLEHVAHIYQDFRLFPQLTAEQNVAFVLRLRGVGAEESLAAARTCLQKVGIGHRLEHLPRELSGGESQRVAIARALVAKPALILADEPTGALDAGHRDDILDTLFEVMPRAAFVLVTHDPKVAERASRVMEMPSVATAGSPLGRASSSAAG